MNKIKREFHLVSSVMQNVISTFWNGLRSPYRLKRLRHFLHRFNQFITDNSSGYPMPHSEEIKELKELTTGLHKLLPHSDLYSYSILIPVYKPKASYFKMALESALNQTAPAMEVLVGFDGVQPDDVYNVFEELKKQNPIKLKGFQLDRETEGGSISASTNAIAKYAQGKFLLLMDHDDWIRPDLLYRYEQTLRLLSNPKNAVLYCDEYKIDEKDNPIPLTGLRKPHTPPFPYVFINWICHCLLIPKALWDQVGGLRVECNGAQDYDIALRLDVAEAQFYNVPVYLYAWRSHAESTAKNSNQKSYVFTSALRALKDYYQAKNLDWKIENGYLPTTYRGIPTLKTLPEVHAIIHYKDQKESILRAAKSILKQTGVKVKITAVDNDSVDKSIASTLTELGAEVIQVNAPSSFAKLNNHAVKSSKFSKENELLLFLNTDVELSESALEEMCRWTDQPHVGLVGCRLNDPSEKLQHGGIDLNTFEGGSFEFNWEHSEKERSFDFLEKAKMIRPVDAISGACILIKKKVFLEIGAFDEIWYPAANSDTHLAMKLKAKGLLCLYTPYAVGIHYGDLEKGNSLVDYENSRWLHELYRT
jgi:GT2 family glycosyltransferase/glycosyltransferase involved in cell wall biosynthesis